MSVRKFCVYKGCSNDPNNTLFHFPKEKDRFLVWCSHAGLKLKGEININAPRYLCEKHFSKNYISTQSRRRMLVHTAVPEKYSEDEPLALETEANIVGIENKKRKQREYTISELTQKPAVKVTVPTIPNKIRILNKESQESMLVYDEDHLNEEVDESEEVRIVVKDVQDISPSEGEEILEEVVEASPSNKIRFYAYKKPTERVSIVGKIQSPQKIEESSMVVETVQMEKASTKLVSRSVETQKSSESSEAGSLENYSEFPINGETFVIMPKRVFEAEMEKLRQEVEKYKSALMKLRSNLDNLF